jgi:hypothetical protein
MGGALEIEELTMERFQGMTDWVKKVGPYAVLGLLVPGGGVAALMLWNSRHGGSHSVAVTRTVRTAAMLAVTLALPSSL